MRIKKQGRRVPKKGRAENRTEKSLRAHRTHKNKRREKKDERNTEKEAEGVEENSFVVEKETFSVFLYFFFPFLHLARKTNFSIICNPYCENGSVGIFQKVRGGNSDGNCTLELLILYSLIRSCFSRFSPSSFLL